MSAARTVGKGARLGIFAQVAFTVVLALVPAEQARVDFADVFTWV